MLTPINMSYYWFAVLLGLLILTYYVQALSIGTLTMLISDSLNASVCFVVSFMFCPSERSQLTRLDFFLKRCFFYRVLLWCICGFAFLFCKPSVSEN